jgi:phage replication O-like protein O
MANPQKENGYTPISNEIMEALAKTRISGEARQVLDVIIRQTYGYNKKIDWITTSQFKEATGLSNMAVYKARKKLKEMNIITISQKGDSQYLNYCLQKNYHSWLLSPKKKVSTKKDIPLSQKGDRLSPKKVTNSLPKSETLKTKDNTTIDNIQKTYPFLSESDFVLEFEEYLKTRKKVTDHAKDLILRKLHKFDKATAVAMLEQSIEHGWIGIFPLKKENDNGKSKRDSETKYAGVEREV